MIDIRTLYAQTGHFTYDPGFTATGSCMSAITFIDGEKGRLTYRGYKIEELAEKSSFMEVCYLLLYGELPSEHDLYSFEEAVKTKMLCHERVKNIFSGFKEDDPPMAIMCTVIGSLSTFLVDKEVQRWDQKEMEKVAISLIAKFATLSAMAFRTSYGLPMVYPRKDMSYTENLMTMMFSDPMDSDPNARPNPLHVKAMDKFLILHADHEQNASTSTVRISGSSHANPLTCISAGIASLWGPAHGGANQACMEMLDEIETFDKVD